MALKRYRRQVIRVHDANDNLPEVILSTGDEAGRIIQLAITGGAGYGTHCRFWLQKDADTNVYQDMESVTAPYPTWEAAINTGGLEPGTYQCMFRVGDNDGSVTETFRTTARVLQGMLIDAEESEEMQSQLSEFEQRTQDAISANQAATAAATEAAASATGAASTANSAATGATSAASAATQAATAANGAASSATSAASGANAAATSATSAAETATGAAASATSAASSANSAATSANSAATAANSAATTATNAANTANTAAGNAATATDNANSATTAATSAATSATNAATAANAAAEDATDAATEARDAAAAALASAGNIVLGEISMLDGSIETVDDAFVSPLRGIEVEGKSTQVSYSGKNLLQASSVFNNTAVYSVDGDVVSVLKNDDRAWPNVAVISLAAGTYTFSRSNTTLRAVIRTSADDYAADAMIIGPGAASRTITSDVDFGIKIKASTTTSGIMYPVTSTFQLEAGSTATSYEPYCGGIPSPNPDYPQTIHSVAEAAQVITGRCVWGGEKMADDIVAAVGDATKAYKGEDADGKYVALVASLAIDGKVFFSKLKPLKTYSAVLKVKKANASSQGQAALNIAWKGSNGISYLMTSEEGTITDPSKAYTVVISSPYSVNMYAKSVIGFYASSIVYIYYESSGLFEGVLTTADFAPYLGTTTPLIPSGTEPLRSLPNGVHDELVVHEDGSREIVRRVGAGTVSTMSPASSVTSLFGGQAVGNYFTMPDIAGLSGNCVYIDKAYWHSANSAAFGSFYTNAKTMMFVQEPSWTKQDFVDAYTGAEVLYPLETPVIEPLPSLTMPSAPSSDVTAWLDSKDESSAPIATDANVTYERSMQIVIDKLEQAIADL